jgi:hypothetical protein
VVRFPEPAATSAYPAPRTHGRPSVGSPLKEKGQRFRRPGSIVDVYEWMLRSPRAYRKRPITFGDLLIYVSLSFRSGLHASVRRA